MALAVVFNTTVAKPAEGSSNRYEEAKNPALKQKYCRLYLVYLEEMGLWAIGRYLSIHYKTVTRSLVQAAQALPVSPTQTEACSFPEIKEFCTFIAKKNLMLALAGGRLRIWQGIRLGLRKKDDQNR